MSAIWTAAEIIAATGGTGRAGWSVSGVSIDSRTVAAGDLFVAQRISNNVLKFPFGGGAPSIVVPMGAFAGQPADIAFGPNGLLYIAATNAIYRFDVSGANGVLVDSFGTGGRFLAFTPSVPEPGTWALMATALALIACYRRRAWR